jgi:hypothetical protein
MTDKIQFNDDHDALEIAEGSRGLYLRARFYLFIYN